MCYTCDVTRRQDGGWFCSDATSKFEGKTRLLLLNVQKSFIHQILSFDLNIYLSQKKRGRKIRCSNTLRRPQVGVIYLHEEELAPTVHGTLVASTVQYKYTTLYKHSIISPMPKICPPTDLDSDFRQVSVLPQLANVTRKP